MGIEEAIECCQRYLESPQPSDFLTLMIKSCLADLLIKAFQCTDDMADLNRSITLLCDLIRSPITSAQFPIIQRLILALSSQFLRLHRTIDSEEIFQLLSIAAANTHAKIPNRFHISCQWAKLARLYKHPSTSTAYESAISLIGSFKHAINHIIICLINLIIKSFFT